MANSEKISEIIDESAFKQVEKLTQLLVNSQGELVKFTIETKKLNDELARSGSVQQFAAAQEKVTKSLKATSDSVDKVRLQELKLADARQKEYEKYEKRLQREVEAVNKREAQAEKNFQKEQARIAKDGATRDKEASLNSERITEQSRIYNQLSAVLEKNRKDARDIGVVYGENSIQFQKAAKGVVELDTRLKSLDAKLGQNQRNVGNYKSGFNGLSNSINQLTREFPAFTFSVQTGFLALSNNIPIFFDQIKQTQNEIKGLRAQGEKVPGLFKQLASSVLSFGTALSIGVTLFTVFAPQIAEFVSSIFKGKSAVDQFTATQKQLNGAILEGSKSAQSEITSLKLSFAAYQNANLPLSRRKEIYEQIQQAYPKYFENIAFEEKASSKTKKAYDELTGSIIATARARAVSDKITENSARALENEQKVKDLEVEKTKQQAIAQRQLNTLKSVGSSASSTGISAQIGLAEKRAADAQRDINNLKTDSNILTKRNLDLEKEVTKQIEAGADLLSGGNKSGKKEQTDLLQFRLKIKDEEIKAEELRNKTIQENENSSLEDRVESTKLFVERTTNLLNARANLEVQKEKITGEEIAAIRAENKNKITEVELSGAKELVKINDDASKALQEIFKLENESLEKSQKDRIEKVKSAGEDRLLEIESNKSKALNSLLDEFEKGAISTEEYNKGIYDIEAKASKERLDIQIAALREEIRIGKQGFVSAEEIASDEAKLNDLLIKADDLKTDKRIDNAKKLEKALKELHDKEKELQQELLNFGVEAVNLSFANKQEKLQLEDEQATERAELERTRIEESLISEDEKKIKLAQLDDKERARKELLDIRQRQIAIQQARFEKAISIGKIIANTAVGVTAALASVPPNVPLSIVIGAIGAAQIAQTLATKIPAFEDGGTMQKSGLALYGEAGIEGRVEPDGSFSLTPPTPTIGHVKGGTEFISNKGLMAMIAKPEKINYAGASEISMDEVIRAVRESGKETARALNSLPPSTQITKSGWRKIQNRNNGWTEYLNSRIN